MTWFLRKAVRLGPLRLNLSKRGVGASIRPAITLLDALGRPTLEPDALWLELEEREHVEVWLRRQLEGLGE